MSLIHYRNCASRLGDPCTCGDDELEQAQREAAAGDWQWKAGIAIAIIGPLVVSVLLWWVTR